MPLRTTHVAVEDNHGPALGTIFDGLPIKSFPYLDDLGSVAPANVIAAVHPGFWPLTTSPLKERGCVERDQFWTAVTGASVTRVQAPAVLANLPRWKSTRAATDGMASQLAASLTNWSCAALVKFDDMTTTNTIFGVYGSSTTRLLCMVGADGAIELQYGTGDRKKSAVGVILPNTYHSVIYSFDAATKAVKIYVDDTTTPVVSLTMTNSPPSSTYVRLMSGAEDTNEMYGELVLFRLWDLTITDATMLKVIMAAMNGIKLL